MTAKIITKRVHDRLDSFVTKNQSIEQTQLVPEQTAPQNKRTLKRNDGLIERVDVSKKVYITEDNRQLLND